MDMIDELAGTIDEKCHVADRPDIPLVPSDDSSRKNAPTSTCLIVLGMAGSGKTTFVENLSKYLTANGAAPYIVNLDPAVRQVPYPVNIDIRDTVKYKAVMKKFGLGPNGGIMTSLNLFTTKFSGVLDLLEKRKFEVKHMIFDTPGQIEVFTWSASGSIITEALADSFPTVIVYVMDVSTSTSPITFMSNMLYACSILYKSKLPFIIALNKIDMVDPTLVMKWISDFEAFDVAVEKEESYAANLSRSLGLILDEFYGAIRTVPVSALTCQGFPKFVEAVEAATLEFNTEYKPEMDKMKADQRESRKLKSEDRFEKLKREVLEISTGPSSSRDDKSRAMDTSVSIGPQGDSNAKHEQRNFDAEESGMEETSFQRFLESAKKAKEIAKKPAA
ncbi:GPN-loop GTPase 1 [Hypsibius exemplaris]|uniref:GPN-loop GTPase n=1 Tax=Hypsibius exemplaris TaxID=2072580 RepID=A0A1W0X787_HYPEX|nr:GPN-loop GTPase 1 [Hypsibius exemplaris]